MTDISNSQLRLIASLSERKHRRANQMFKVEGDKAVADTLGHFQLELLAATAAWIERNGSHLAPEVASRYVKATNRDLGRMSSMSTAPEVIAVYKLPTEAFELDAIASTELVAAIDGIQDPGNLGTIIRTCDWFGIRHIVCSSDTVDTFNPKTIQATMGAISRVKLRYGDLAQMLKELSQRMSVYAMMLEGQDLFKAELSPGGAIVIGNEGSGIRPSTLEVATRRLTIPSFAAGDGSTSESLNAAIAAAVTISQFRSRL